MSVLSLLDPSALRARVTGRSWWVVRYRDGRTVNEWDGPDWSLLPRQGLRAVRLYCPDGQVAELGNSVDASDRLFQLKVGVMQPGRRHQQAHLIGIVTGTDGQCTVAAWDYDLGRLLTFDDNVCRMAYRGIGRIAADHVGIRPD